MYFINDKCHIVGEVDSYCQLAVTFFSGLALSNQRQCSASVHFNPPPFISLDPPYYTLLEYCDCFIRVTALLEYLDLTYTIPKNFGGESRAPLDPRIHPWVFYRDGT